MSTTHLCPPDGFGCTPCCGLTPFELKCGDRMTTYTSLVTCSRERPHAVDDADDAILDTLWKEAQRAEREPPVRGLNALQMEQVWLMGVREGVRRATGALREDEEAEDQVD